jgi:hypothetical protein
MSHERVGVWVGLWGDLVGLTARSSDILTIADCANTFKLNKCLDCLG